MAIAQIAAPNQAGKPGVPCKVTLALETIDADEAAALLALLADPSWRYQALSDELRADADTPLELDAQSLSRHARGLCCGRKKLR